MRFIKAKGNSYDRLSTVLLFAADLALRLYPLTIKFFFTTPMGKIIVLGVDSLNSIENVKAKIQDKEGILPDQQMLVSDESVLEDGLTLSEHHMAKRTLRLRG